MLKVGWVFAKVSCIERKKLLHRPKPAEFVGRKGSRKSQGGWGTMGTIINSPFQSLGIPVLES